MSSLSLRLINATGSGRGNIHSGRRIHNEARKDNIQDCKKEEVLILYMFTSLNIEFILFDTQSALDRLSLEAGEAIDALLFGVMK